MRTVALALVASLVGSVAFADSTTVTKTDTPYSSSTTVKKEEDGDVVTKRRVESTGAVGCDTKSVTKTDDDGESTTKTKTRC